MLFDFFCYKHLLLPRNGFDEVISILITLTTDKYDAQFSGASCGMVQKSQIYSYPLCYFPRLYVPTDVY